MKGMPDPITFKVDSPGLWEMLLDGRKKWDARLWDMADDRCYRLSWFRVTNSERPPWAPHDPEEPTVSFCNSTTGDVLTFRYLGVEFPPWAPGWGFILLGERCQ